MAIKVALFLALAALVGQSMACGINTCNSFSNSFLGSNCGLGNYYGNLFGSNFCGGIGGFNNPYFYNNIGCNSFGQFGYPGLSTCASTIVPGSTCCTKCFPTAAVLTNCVGSSVC